jgi:crotonobetainyl-CoA:carnitine CoA-transferase CaiB-like acyl-CoA transferase
MAHRRDPEHGSHRSRPLNTNTGQAGIRGMNMLDGIRIVSTAVNVPGPVAAAMLRDKGAAIVKVEPPEGDPLSRWAPGWYSELCAGVDVVRLDLKSPDGREGLDAWLASADLLVTSSRPGSLQRLGLAWTDLHARHARLCHVAIVGYAPPRDNLAGHDLTYQAEVGLLTPPGMPVTLVADLSGAQRAVVEALNLLFGRERGGAAGRAEVVLADCAKLFAEPLRHGLTSSTGLLGGACAAYGIYPTRDGWVTVAALEPQFRVALARELGVDVENRSALASALMEKSASEWQHWAETRDLPLHALVC